MHSDYRDLPSCSRRDAGGRKARSPNLGVSRAFDTEGRGFLSPVRPSTLLMIDGGPSVAPYRKVEKDWPRDFQSWRSAFAAASRALSSARRTTLITTTGMLASSAPRGPRKGTSVSTLYAHVPGLRIWFNRAGGSRAFLSTRPAPPRWCPLP